MLESILVIRHIVVVIVGIGKECVSRGKDVGRTQIRRWQLSLLGILDDENLLRVVAQILAQLVSEIGVGVTVSDDFNRFRGPYGTVVCGNDDLVVGLCQRLEEFCHDRVPEPADGQVAIGRLVAGKFPNHLRLGPGMREHIDEIDHHHIEVIFLAPTDAVKEFLCTSRVVDLMIG